MKEKKLVPKLRFPGFTEPWEQRKLGEMASFSKGNGYFKSDLKSTGIPIILYGRLYTKYETVIEDIDTFADAKEGAVYSLGGEVIVPASGETAEEISIASVVQNPGVLLGGDLNIIRPTENLLPSFLALSISNGSAHRAMSKRAQGKSVVHLHNEDLAQIDLKYPSVEEQSKITACINWVDNLITLHQRKLEHLKLKKKSLLQKLFPKEGEVYPELRFPGFTDPWEQRKGDEVFISVSDKGYPQLPVLSASQELGMVYRDENGIDIHHNKSNEDTYKRVLPGQFVIHLRSFQGGFAYSNVEGITSPAYTVITFKNPELHYGLFWKQVFKSLTFIKHLETITYGIRDGRSISFSDFRSLKLCYPTYGEQKFIGDGLEKTDNLITLHQRKLEHLQLLKKALLQQLFV